MPMYSTKCTQCGHVDEILKSMKAPMPACACGGVLAVDWTRQGAPKVPAHDLHGERSLLREVRAKPHEVAELRQKYGDVGHCWGDDGRVRVSNRSEGRRFWRKDQEIRDRYAGMRAQGMITKKEHAAAEKQAAKIIAKKLGG